MGRHRKDILASTQAAWGPGIPDWVSQLARAVMRTSMADSARATGYSAATVSYVLANKYSGDIARVEQSVRGAFMEATVSCPIVGEIGLNRCLSEQKKNFRGSSAIRTQLFHKCRGIGMPRCPHSSVGRETP